MSDSKMTALINALGAYGINVQPTGAPPPLPPSAPIESLSGKTILLGMTLTSIVDKNLDTWTLGTDGQVYKNKVHAGNSANATLLSYYNEVVYHKNQQGNYYNWDYTTLSWAPAQSPIPAPAPVPTIPPSPIQVTPTSKLLSFLRSIKGKNAISGQFVERGYMTSVDAILSSTGKYPGLLGFDCYYMNAPLSFRADISWVPKAIAHWKAGGICTLSLAMPNPQTGGGIQDKTCDINAMLTTGTSVNTALNGMLNDIAVGLLQLKDAGVPIICRFFHEHDGNWFWYGRQNASNAQIRQVFSYLDQYMSVIHALNNILWLNGMNAGSATMDRVQPNVTDLIGVDGYTSNPAGLKSDFDKFALLQYPLMLSEYGAGNPGVGDANFNPMTLINALKPGGSLNNVVSWLNWWDGNAGGLGWGMGTWNAGLVKQALSDPYVLNRGSIHL